MSKTLGDIKTYLELLDIPKNKIDKLLDDKQVILYSLLRDRLSYTELLELNIILDNVIHKKENMKDIDLSRFFQLSKKDLRTISDYLDLKTNSHLELSSILQTEPKDIALNLVNLYL